MIPINSIRARCQWRSEHPKTQQPKQSLRKITPVLDSPTTSSSAQKKHIASTPNRWQSFLLSIRPRKYHKILPEEEVLASPSGSASQSNSFFNLHTTGSQSTQRTHNVSTSGGSSSFFSFLSNPAAVRPRASSYTGAEQPSTQPDNKGCFRFTPIIEIPQHSQRNGSLSTSRKKILGQQDPNTPQQTQQKERHMDKTSPGGNTPTIFNPPSAGFQSTQPTLTRAALIFHQKQSKFMQKNLNDPQMKAQHMNRTPRLQEKNYPEALINHRLARSERRYALTATYNKLQPAKPIARVSVSGPTITRPDN